MMRRRGALGFAITGWRRGLSKAMPVIGSFGGCRTTPPLPQRGERRAEGAVYATYSSFPNTASQMQGGVRLV